MYENSARIYDLVYTGTGIKDYVAESEGLHRIVEEAVPGAKTLLDVACGTGAHLEQLRRWYAVEGADASPAMLRAATARLPGVPLHQVDMRTLDLGRSFDAVTCLFSSIGYIEAADLNSTIQQLAKHVARPGVLILDGWVRPEHWRTDVESSPDIASDGDTTVVRLALSRRVGDVTQLDMHHLVRTRAGVDYFVETHRLTLIATEVYVEAMRSAGLSPTVISDFMPGRDRVVGVAGG